MASALLGLALSVLTLANAAAPVRGVPPIGITVTAVADVPPKLLSMILDEADAIWRPTGIRFVWQHAPASIPTMLHVTIDHARRPPIDADVPLGWVVFNDGRSPEPEIHLSYASALEYLQASRLVVGNVERMPLLERYTLLSRALGRALAHELGHYLLASKSHAPRGLMQTHRSASDLFGMSLAGFTISAEERSVVAARLGPPIVVGSR
jgi:hypothetical protein